MMPVVFDLDGTLVDSLPGIANAANRLLAEEGLAPLPQATVGGFVGMGVEVFLDRLIAATDLDAADRPRLARRFLPIYEEASLGTPLFDGVSEALGLLKARGIPLGICTNKPSGPLRFVLEGLPEASLFDVVIAGDTLPQRKPDPAPLVLAFQKLGATRGLYVGDSETDAETARRANMPFALFTRGIRVSPVHEIPHDVAFDDFARLSGIYDGLLR
jgi:phosphoglycolate phosphatase